MIEDIQSKTNKIILLFVMCVALMFSLASFSMWPIFLVKFRDLWELNNTQIGWITGSYFFGYLLLTPVYVGLTDKVDAKWIFIFASLSIIGGCLGLLYFANGFWPTCFFWGIVGSGHAGTYMPGLQILNSRLNKIDRVKFTPWYTSSMGIGTGLSFALIGYVFSNFDWFEACLIGMITSGVSATLVLLFISPSKPTSSNQETNRHFLDLSPAFRNKSALSYIISYGTHTFELMAYRAWIFAFLVWSISFSGENISFDNITFIIASIMILGMVSSLTGAKICLEYGRRKVLMLIGLITFSYSILIALSIPISFWYLVLVIAIYNILIMLDSGALTAGTVAVSKDDERGAILAVHSLFGFGSGALAGPIIGFVLDLNGGAETNFAWSLAFFAMGLGSLFVFLIQIYAYYYFNIQMKNQKLTKS